MDMNISEKDKEYIQKQISKAIRSYDWEKATHHLMDEYMDWLYRDSVLDDMFITMMEEVMRKMFKEKGLIEDE